MPSPLSGVRPEMVEALRAHFNRNDQRFPVDDFGGLPGRPGANGAGTTHSGSLGRISVIGWTSDVAGSVDFDCGIGSGDGSVVVVEPV